mmetsp:Transcript_25802/g.39247  ORF Transcript_25802/g.39247 Transcript_25802/m.39247 type:complete len:81 (+) Transcript_25802:199-441(+)
MCQVPATPPNEVDGRFVGRTGQDSLTRAENCGQVPNPIVGRRAEEAEDLREALTSKKQAQSNNNNNDHGAHARTQRRQRQ